MTNNIRLGAHHRRKAQKLEQDIYWVFSEPAHRYLRFLPLPVLFDVDYGSEGDGNGAAERGRGRRGRHDLLGTIIFRQSRVFLYPSALFSPPYPPLGSS